MKKLIDLLNELAVAEERVSAYERLLQDRPEDRELENKWDDAYDEMYGIFRATLDRLVDMLGVHIETARAMVLTGREALVKIASQEA